MFVSLNATTTKLRVVCSVPILVYKLSKDNQCLSSFNYILEDVGGINIIICVGIVVGTLIIFMVIMMIRKLSFSDRNLYEQS